MTDADAPKVTTPADASEQRRFRCFRVETGDGGASWSETRERCTIGSHPSNDVAIDDPTVSRFHCEITVTGGRFRVRDLGSTNGTLAGGVTILDALVAPGTVLTLGRRTVVIAAADREGTVPAFAATRFGGLVGSSIAMRELFARLERAAASDATVLLHGETGTGKEGAAAALHASSARSSGAFVAIDCGAIPLSLFEAELFGAEPGAYTGAVGRRIGAFEEASGGTLFLDEVGELPLEAQAKLLRALESRQVRRLGSRTTIDCDVRVIAATNRDLRGLVNEGAFRGDLYHRLAVLQIALPPLRDRLSDLPELVAHLLDRLQAKPEDRARLTSPDHIASLSRCAWMGNVRELRNYLEQSIVFGAVIGTTAPAGEQRIGSYEVARREALARFERDYVDRLLRDADGNVAQAAQLAGLHRAYLYRLIQRHRDSK